MTTTTSYSNAGRFRPLYGSILKRNAGYFGLISALIFLFYPVQYALEIAKQPPAWWVEQNSARLVTEGQPLIADFYNLVGYGKNFTGVSAFFFSAIMILMPIVLALMLNSYMHSKKAADVFHSLPVRRETLLLANAAVGMTILTVPVVISNIAIAVMMTVKFGWMPQLIGGLLMDMIGWLACALAIYAVTTLASALSGTVFDSLIFSGMLLFSLPAVSGIYIMLCALFLHGYSPSAQTAANLLYTSPTFIMVVRMFNAEGGTMISAARDLLASNIAIFVYLALGVAILLLAARLYRSRRSELAETTGYVGPLPLATKLVGTLICGILTGMLFSAMNDNSQLVYILWAMIGGMVAYAILDVILSRGFKHLVKSLPIGAGMIAFTVISSWAIMNGGFGYETRVPKAENVASVSIQGLNSFNNNENGSYDAQTGDWEWNKAVLLSDPQNVQTILDFHTGAIEGRNLNNGNTPEDEEYVYQWVQLEYQLKSGGRMTRDYRHVSLETLKKLNVLQFAPEFLTQKDQAFTTPAANITEWKVTNTYGSETQRLQLTREESARLLEAVQADILARTPETIQARPVAWVSWTAQYMLEKDALDGLPAASRVSGGNFNVLATDAHTLDFLRQKNLLESLEPDWSKCTAVSLAVGGKYSSNFDSGMYRRILPENLYLSQERENIESTLRYREEEEKTREAVWTTTETIVDGEVVTQRSAQYYWDTFLLETPEEIAAVNESIVGIGTNDQRLVQVIFFFEGNETGLPALANYDALPEAIKEKCREMWGSDFEDNM